MPRHVMLMFNMGHCGGMWFQEVCNCHPDVQVWQEVNNHVAEAKGVGGFEKFYNLEMVRNPHKVIGFVKGFNNQFPDTVKISKSVYQMYRNPIGVVDAKIGLKTAVCKARGVIPRISSYQEVFEAHIEFYAWRYQQYLDNRYQWPVVRLEDLNDSLLGDAAYLKFIMQELLDVEWTDAIVAKNRDLWNVQGRMKRAYAVHKPDDDIFNAWEPWKKEIFLRYFETIMKESGYTCPSM